MVYDKIPIVDAARRCGLVIDSRTLRRSEVEASCPFCGDHGVGKYHLSLNTDTDRCNLCGAHGNSVSLYARLNSVSNKEAYLELKKGGNVYRFPQQPTPQNTERHPLPLGARHAAYAAMLEHLTLLDRHGENLLGRGLSEERIRISTAVCQRRSGEGGFSPNSSAPRGMSCWACQGSGLITASGW